MQGLRTAYDQATEHSTGGSEGSARQAEGDGKQHKAQVAALEQNVGELQVSGAAASCITIWHLHFRTYTLAVVQPDIRQHVPLPPATRRECTSNFAFALHGFWIQHVRH